MMEGVRMSKYVSRHASFVLDRFGVPNKMHFEVGFHRFEHNVFRTFCPTLSLTIETGKN